MQKADFYLVAVAHAMRRTVVTYEKSASQSVRSIKIPDACKALAVDSMAPHEMLRDEGAVFDIHQARARFCQRVGSVCLPPDLWRLPNSLAADVRRTNSGETGSRDSRLGALRSPSESP